MMPDHDRRTTLTDEVHDRLRTLIVDHELGAGERLTIDTLATRLEVSATPVREALARVAAEGLACYEPLVGYRVTAPLDADAYSALVEARQAIEPTLAALAADRRTSSDVASGRALVAPTPGSHRREAIAADAAFHGWVAQCARNPFLEEARAGLHAHVHLYRLHHPADVVGVTGAEHLEILEAIADQDSEDAARAMAAHLYASVARHSAGLGARNQEFA